MNSSSVAANAVQPRSASRSSWRRRIWRGEAATAESSCHCEVGHAHRRALVPRHEPQRAEVRLDHEVAVAASPTRTSRSRRPCSSRRRRPAGSCTPPAPCVDHLLEEVVARRAACPGGGPACPRSRAGRCRSCRPRRPSRARRGSSARQLRLGLLDRGELLLGRRGDEVVARVEPEVGAATSVDAERDERGRRRRRRTSPRRPRIASTSATPVVSVPPGVRYGRSRSGSRERSTMCESIIST